MMDITTFSSAGWDIVDVSDPEDRNTDHTWNIVDGMTYPFFSRQDMINIPTRELTVTVDGMGSTEPTEGTHAYNYNTAVNVTAIQATGWRFSHWSGDVPEGGETTENITVVMDGDKSLIAHFEQIYHNLTLDVSGEGTTTPSIDNHTYLYGAAVNVTAIPATGWRFSHWYGDVPDDEETTENITVVMDSDKSLTAHFEQIYHNLTLDVSGEGTTTPPIGNHTYTYGSAVNVTAIPAPGWRFSHWSGDVPDGEETTENITVFMDGDKSLTAHFQELLFLPENISLTVTPDEGEVPLEVTITVSADNIGLLDGSIDLVVDDEVIYTLVIPAEGTADHTLVHTFETTGTFEIVFGELSESVVVEEDDGFPLWIPLLIAAAAISLAAIFFVIKKKPTDEPGSAEEEESADDEASDDTIEEDTPDEDV